MRLLSIFLLCSTIGFSQDYFQQEVNYNIDVTLDDKANVLNAFESFEYINNSPDELSFIYIHLWPNAYEDNTSAMSMQHYRDGNIVMENNTDEDRGFIDSLDFKVNGESAEFLYNLSHRDIGKLILKTPLKPGEKITVSTPFRVKIPNGNISRLGHVGESFQITQWYPKPAVYDKDGWHEMPYLTQGEFYSEFGSFYVSITLPENYIVGATGDLQTKSEIEFLTNRAKETKAELDSIDTITRKTFDNEFPESSEKMKTIRYTQSRVHDFAWFADKRYKVLKGEVELPNSNRNVTTWAMFTPGNSNLWKDAIEYINDGTYYYSKWNGDYPYNQVTAVDGTISAGGGMEYPNVTVIGSMGSATQLELVIVHEVGHNWFYGILGSNERVHPWMDEGMNTANEIRYFQTKYPENQEFSDNFGSAADKIHLGGMSHHCGNHMTYGFSANNGKDQPIELHSNDYIPLNYGAIVYAKTGLVFTYVRDYLGEEMYDKCMSAYYEKWKFKHPMPEDMKQVFESISGKDLGWLFDEIINTTGKIDFKLRTVKQNDDGSYTVKVDNVGDIRSPVRVDAYSGDKIIETIWLESNPDFSVDEGKFTSTNIEKVIVDGENNMPDVNRMNNSWEKSRLLNKVEPINFEFLAGDNETDKNTVWWTPMIGANAYDQFMLGALFHNITAPKNKLEFYVAPLYSFGNKRLAGLGDVHLNFTPRILIKKIEFGVKGQTFGEERHNEFFGQVYEQYKSNWNRENPFYWVIKPYVFMELGNNGVRKNYSQSIEAQYVWTQNVINGRNQNLGVKGGFIKYNIDFKKRKYALNADLRIDVLGDQILANYSNANIYLDITQSWTYNVKKEKQLELRIFAGKSLYTRNFAGFANDSRFGFALGGQNGTQDVFYEQLMFGRNEVQGVWAQQRVENHGAFKTVSDFGFSQSFMASANLYAELPWGPIGVFADYGVFDNGNKLITSADAGLGLRLLNGDLAIYFPLIQTDNLKNSLNGSSYFQQIRFTLNLSNYSYQKLLQKL